MHMHTLLDKLGHLSKPFLDGEEGHRIWVLPYVVGENTSVVVDYLNDLKFDMST